MQGTSQARREDLRLLTGRGCFIADRISENTLRAGFVRADLACATIAALDIDQARAMEGVVAVFTAEDLEREGFNSIGDAVLPRDDGGQPGSYPQPLLNVSVVRHVGVMKVFTFRG